MLVLFARQWSKRVRRGFVPLVFFTGLLDSHSCCQKPVRYCPPLSSSPRPFPCCTLITLSCSPSSPSSCGIYQYILPVRRTFAILAEDIKQDRRERWVRAPSEYLPAKTLAEDTHTSG